MKIEIEVYKGHQISYNDDTDKFECEMEFNGNVKNSKRGSLKDLRKEIDLFIKENLEFKPFTFLEKSQYEGDTFGVKKCTAIRTDGTLVVSPINGTRNSYYGAKEMKRACIFNADLVKELADADAALEAARELHKKRIAELKAKLEPLDVSHLNLT